LAITRHLGLGVLETRWFDERHHTVRPLFEFLSYALKDRPDAFTYERFVGAVSFREAVRFVNDYYAPDNPDPKRRDRNGQYLAAKLSRLPGLHPQKRIAGCQRHSYHLFMMRIDRQKFGAPRAAVIKALQAEGIPCSGGYPISLHEQPLFRNKAFGPYLPKASARLDYRKVHCPNSDLLCREQTIWFEQSLLLGQQQDMDAIVRAFEKIHDHRELLNSHSLSYRSIPRMKTM
jgi:hypothetical protein